MSENCDLILGEDGKVHTGEVVRKMSATLMQTDCRVVPLRSIGLREEWWTENPHRVCGSCLEELP